eukprot:TRINITY_DN6455_c0_g2_i6.p1 TRINITY_DN6455_c0_g2~~TRINITY_DN6455_c0_g2_i6.p1  ORF type:complete len:677 (+),score=239.98 TRINITY_DN6455_c0_g2_i6:132-2162(+)
MEGDFERLKDRNAELDIEILNSTQEVQKLQTDNKRMERELKRVRKRNEELEKEAMEGRSDKAEIMVELERTQLELTSAKEELAKKSKQVLAPVENKEGIVAAEDRQEIQKEGEVKEQVDVQEEAKAEVSIEKASGNEAELKRKLFEFKKKIDSLQAKVDDLTDDNNRLVQDNEKYLVDVQTKGNKIKELQLVCAELEEDKSHLNMKLKNVDIIQRQDEKTKNRLSITYQKFTAQDANDPFRSAGRKNLNEPIAEGIGEADEDEDCSLASQLGNAQETTGLAAELNALSSGDIGKGRTSTMFESREYFKQQTMKDIDTITEEVQDKDEQAPEITNEANEEDIKETHVVEEENVNPIASEANEVQAVASIDEQPVVSEMKKEPAVDEEQPSEKQEVQAEIKEEPERKEEPEAKEEPESKEPTGEEQSTIKEEAPKSEGPIPEPEAPNKAVEVDAVPEVVANIEEAVSQEEQLPSQPEAASVEQPQEKIKTPDVSITASPEASREEEEKLLSDGVPAQSTEEVKKPTLTSAQTAHTSLDFTSSAETDTAKVMKEKFMNKIKEENKKMVAVLGSSGLDIRPSKIATFDFLTLKKNPKLIKMLAARKETMSNVAFSDYMYLIKENDLSHKTKHILYINETGIYVLLKQSCKIKRVTPLTDLKSVIVVKTSGILLALHFEKA